MPDSDLLNGESCGVDDPECPAEMFCAVVRVATGDTAPICVREDICTEVHCMQGEGECAVAESFPVQVFCSGTCSGSHCDDPVHD